MIQYICHICLKADINPGNVIGEDSDRFGPAESLPKMVLVMHNVSPEQQVDICPECASTIAETIMYLQDIREDT